MTYWSEDRLETLKSLWRAGLSASEVAHTLGNVSRNAVIGKIHRLGLAGRAGSACVTRTRPPRGPRSSAHSPIVAVVEQEPFKFEDGTFVTMHTIKSSMCRWPIGDPKTSTFHFCGRSPKPGSPYCEAHSQRAHQPHGKFRGARNGQMVDRHALS